MIEDVKGGQLAQGLNMEQPTSIWTKNFILLCLANFAVFMGMQMLLPTLPLYLTEIGGNQRAVGYAMGVFTISAMAMRPIAGWLVDNYGRKKVMLLGMVMALAATALYKLAADVSLMMWVRGFHGMAFGVVTTAIGTIVVDSLPTARMGEGMGYFGLTSSFSMALAPMIGLWLISDFGYPMLFLVVSLLAVLAFGSSFPVRGSNAPVKPAQGTADALSFWASLIEKKALPAAGVMLFLAVMYGAVISFIALYAAELNVTNIGLFFTANAIVMLISRPISGRWTDRGGTYMVLLIGHLALVVSLAALGIAQTITGFIISGAFLGLGFGFCMPTLQALSVRMVAPHRRGAATGTFFIALDLGIGVGTILWGYVAEATGYRIMFLTTLLPLALAWVVYSRYKDK